MKQLSYFLSRKLGGTRPEAKRRYIIFYLAATCFCAGLMLTQYAQFLAGIVPLGSPFREYWICGGQILFQGLVVIRFAKEKAWAYLFVMMTISFCGSLLLLVVLLTRFFFILTPVAYCQCFMVVAALMLLAHIRGTGLLALGWVPTASWIFYRMVVLGIILIF